MDFQSRFALIPDINIPIYAYDSSSPRRKEARQWWEKTLPGERPVGLSWATMLGFIRIMTHPAIQAQPRGVTNCV